MVLPLFQIIGLRTGVNDYDFMSSGVRSCSAAVGAGQNDGSICVVIEMLAKLWRSI